MSKEFFFDSSFALKHPFWTECRDMFYKYTNTAHINFNQDYWVIPYTKQHTRWKLNVRLDFSCFKQWHDYFGVQIVSYEGIKTTLNITQLVKWLLLTRIYNSPVDYRSVYELERLKMLFAYMVESDIKNLEKEHLKGLYSVMLSSDLNDGVLFKRLSSPSYKVRFGSFRFHEVKKKLTRCNIEGLIGSFTTKHETKAFNDACLAIMNLTLKDYKKGGSFDFLTLDVGRHYVDYCSDFFEKRFVFASAARLTMHDFRLEYSINQAAGNSEFMGALNGCFIADSETGKARQEWIKQRFCYHYNIIQSTCGQFTLNGICFISEQININSSRLDDQELLRSLLYSLTVDRSIKSSERICAEYKNIAKRKLQVNEIKSSLSKYLESIIIEPEQISSIWFELVDTDENHYLTFREFDTKWIKDVIGAGCVMLLAFTGWRASEYDFTLGNCYIQNNTDILDSSYSPYNCYIQWTSHKTNKNTLLLRDITVSTNILFRQINYILNGSFYDSGGDPYLLTEDRLSDYVWRLWGRFPKEYDLFKYVKEDAKDVDSRELFRLKKELLKNLPALELSRKGYPEPSTGRFVRFRETLKRYICGELLAFEDQVLCSNLSSDTLQHLKNQGLKLSDEEVNSIREELIRGMKKPTPHAFRHMWAEAVLRRYKGDVGRYIRSNFKHIDERFFMAYLRDKEVIELFNTAKRSVINSTVKRALAKNKESLGKDIGGFAHFIKKAVSLTQVIDIEVIENRVLELKVNSFSTCLLRDGTQSHAKCSIDGKPQRHNAEPNLCLGCINSSISHGNFEGILASINDNVLACRNSKLPVWFKKNSAETVKLAMVRIKELYNETNDQRMPGAIAWLQESLIMANQSEELIS